MLCKRLAVEFGLYRKLCLCMICGLPARARRLPPTASSTTTFQVVSKCALNREKKELRSSKLPRNKYPFKNLSSFGYVEIPLVFQVLLSLSAAKLFQEPHLPELIFLSALCVHARDYALRLLQACVSPVTISFHLLSLLSPPTLTQIFTDLIATTCKQVIHLQPTILLSPKNL